MTKNTVTELGDVLGTARRAGSFEPNTPEWHALRDAAVGGSEVAAIVGCSPWRSPFTMWAEKTKRVPRQRVDSEAAEWGTLLEPVIIAKFAAKHPELNVITQKDTWVNLDRPWQLSNPDALFVDENGEWGIFEAKTAGYEDDWRAGGEYVVPVYYRTQVQWYLQTFGLRRAVVGVLFGGNKYREIEVPANDFEQATNLATVENWREYVAKDLQPDYDGANSTLETVRAMHPAIDPEGEVELGELGHDYLLALHDHELATEALNKAKSRVFGAMGNAKRGTINGVWKISRQARNGGVPYLVNKKG